MDSRKTSVWLLYEEEKIGSRNRFLQRHHHPQVDVLFGKQRTGLRCCGINKLWREYLSTRESQPPLRGEKMMGTCDEMRRDGFGSA